MSYKPIVAVFIILLIFLIYCSEKNQTDKPVVSLRIGIEKDISQQDAILYANEYDKIQTSLENIVEVFYNDTDKAADLLIKLTKDSNIFSRKLAKYSKKSKDNIFRNLKKKEINNKILIKLTKMYNDNNKFAKAYDGFVQSFKENKE